MADKTANPKPVTHPNPVDDGFAAWMPSAQAATSVWARCLRGDWMVFALFVQTGDTAERQRLAGLFYGMLSPFLTADHIPEPGTLAFAQSLGAEIQSYVSTQPPSNAAAMVGKIGLDGWALMDGVTYTPGHELEFAVLTGLSALARVLGCAPTDVGPLPLILATSIVNARSEAGTYPKDQSCWLAFANDMRDNVPFTYLAS